MRRKEGGRRFSRRYADVEEATADLRGSTLMRRTDGDRRIARRYADAERRRGKVLKFDYG
jgi:hypothetical protein